MASWLRSGLMEEGDSGACSRSCRTARHAALRSMNAPLSAGVLAGGALGCACGSLPPPAEGGTAPAPVAAPAETRTTSQGRAAGALWGGRQR
jgi:hypothetical protein